MSNEKGVEPFLSRWARQKRDARSDVQPENASTAVAPDELDLSKLPNVEDLTADSDITGFLQKGVPEALRKLALRRMWSLDPAIRDFVEIAENQWDFNAPGGIPGLFQDVTEGTDMGVWLAQATQSVIVQPDLGADVAPPADTSSAVVAQCSDCPPPIDLATVDTVAALAAAQQDSADVAASQSVGVKDPSVTITESIRVSVRTQDLPDNAEELSQSCALQQPASLLTRRRHGGALPQ